MDIKKGFKYFIIPELKLIVECWIGKFSFYEILEFKNMESTDPEWKDYYHVLADDRQTNFRIEGLLEDASKYFPMSKKFIKKRKTAILTSLPHQVATTMLLNIYKHPDAQVELNIFSTVLAALKWLDINADELARIEMILNNLNDEIKKSLK